MQSNFSRLVQEAQRNKPNPIGQPPIWALNRQQLCAALPWYKSFQTGLYANQKNLFGLLIDNEVAPGDIVTERTVICRMQYTPNSSRATQTLTYISGGCRGTDSSTGKKGQIRDQNDTDSMVQTFKNALDDKRHVGVIAGELQLIIKHFCLSLFVDRTT